MRLQEIEQRLSAIKADIDAEGADLDALETEINALKEERAAILDKVEKRKRLENDVLQSQKITHDFQEEQMEKRTFAPESAEYRSAYFKHLQGKPLDAEERAVITAGAVIPTETLNKIVEKLEQTSALYARITKTFIPSNLSIPVENAKNDAAWVAMGTAATDAADSFNSVTLAAYKLIKTIEIGADVERMSIDAFESFIVNALVKKINRAIENSILKGTGSAQPTGLLKAGEITEIYEFTKLGMTFKDLLAIIAALPTEYHNGADFTMPRKLFFEEILGMTTTAGERVVVLDPQAPSKFNIMGYPVILNDNMDVDTIVFGNFEYYHMNFASDIAISADESVGFRTGSKVYRAMVLADGKKTLAEAFVKSTRKAT